MMIYLYTLYDVGPLSAGAGAHLEGGVRGVHTPVLCIPASLDTLDTNSFL